MEKTISQNPLCSFKTSKSGKLNETPFSYLYRGKYGEKDAMIA
jgi:hypothetical protein